jgi:RNA polymerase sigma factor (sigma-70 family)
MLLGILDESGARLHALLTRITLREDVAEDLLQDLFLKLRSSESFDGARDPTAYAFRSAMHLALDWRRKQTRSAATALLDEPPAAEGDRPLDRLSRDEDYQAILDALSELSETQQEVVVRRHLQHEEFEEIAKQIGKTPHQVRGLLHKGIAKLRTIVATRQARNEAPHA